MLGRKKQEAAQHIHNLEQFGKRMTSHLLKLNAQAKHTCNTQERKQYIILQYAS